MKRIIIALLLITLLVPAAFAGSIESEIKEFAAHKYPNNARMQRYTYNKQIAAYNYMLSVEDPEVKKIAIRTYPNDYAMQKYTYNKQLSAKKYGLYNTAYRRPP